MTIRRRPLVALAFLFTVCLSCLRPAYAQFDMGAIIAFLTTLNTTMQSALAVPLAAINTLKQADAAFQQNVLYPVNQITSLKGLASSFNVQVGGMQTLFSGRNLNATMPATTALERLTLSGSATNINQLRTAYIAVYGDLPSSSTTPTSIRNGLDAQDAAAQDGFSRAIQLDALATQEAQQAKNIMSQLQNAAPGTGSILAAQASALIVQANAYTQMGQAELLRLKATQMAINGQSMKRSVAASSGQSIQ